MVPTHAITIRFAQAARVKALNIALGGRHSNVCSDAMLESAVNAPIDQQHHAQENHVLR